MARDSLFTYAVAGPSTYFPLFFFSTLSPQSCNDCEAANPRGRRAVAEMRQRSLGSAVLKLGLLK